MFMSQLYIPLYEQATFHLSLHLLMDIWVASTSALLEIMLLRIHTFNLCGHEFVTFLWGIYTYERIHLFLAIKLCPEWLHHFCFDQQCVHGHIPSHSSQSLSNMYPQILIGSEKNKLGTLWLQLQKILCLTDIELLHQWPLKQLFSRLNSYWWWL